MAHVDGGGKRFNPSSKKYDRSVEDALQTMERLALWLEEAKRDNVWQDVDDALQMSVLHGMLSHVRDACADMLASAGPEVEDTVKRLRTLATHKGETAQ